MVVADFAKARQSMDDSRELFEEIVRLYFAEVPGYLQSAREGMARGDAEAIRHAAHAIKGMVGVFAAEAAMQAAAELEHGAAEPGRENKLNDLEAAIQSLDLALRDYRW